MKNILVIESSSRGKDSISGKLTQVIVEKLKAANPNIQIKTRNLGREPFPLYLAIASGGVYSEGPMKSFDFAEPYLRAILGFLGMTDVRSFRAEGTAIPQMKETALKKAIDSVRIVRI